MQFLPYLNFNGTCGEAFRFYHELFGGTLDVSTFGDSPMAKEVPQELHHLVIHAYLETGDGKLMGSDAPPGQFAQPQGLFVSTHPSDVESGQRIFNELSRGGTVIMAFEKTFWAERFGMVTDRFGTPWMVNVAPA